MPAGWAVNLGAWPLWHRLPAHGTKQMTNKQTNKQTNGTNETKRSHWSCCTRNVCINKNFATVAPKSQEKV